MKKLYPIKFEPILLDKIWGGEKLKKLLNKSKASNKCGESWEISAYDGNISVVSNGFLKGNTITELIEVYMGDLVGDKIYDKFGIEFPLLIKFIDANEVLSVQVHPDDETAMKRHNACGKTEMWYVLDSETGSELISGFKVPVRKEDFLEKLNSGSIMEILNSEKVKEGDVFFMPAGRVHAIGAGIVLTEIQQTSDLTYRIYDFDRRDNYGNLRELHINEAMEVIDFDVKDSYRTSYNDILNNTVELESCPYFTTNLIHFTNPVEKDYILIDSFVILICTMGKVEIRYHDNETISIQKGETLLIPAELKNLQLTPSEESKILEVYVK